MRYIILAVVAIMFFAAVAMAKGPCDHLRMTPARFMKCRLRANAADDDTTQVIFGGMDLADDDEGQSAKLDERKVWAQYRSELINILTQGNPKSAPYMQIMTIPEDADWDEAGQEAKLQRLCDTVPYTDGFYDTTPYKISKQYKQYINNLNVGRKVISASAKKELDKLQASFAALDMQIHEERMKCWMSFEMSGSNLSLDQFEKKKCPAYQKKNSDYQDQGFLISWYTAKAFGTSALALQEAKFQTNAGTQFEELYASGSLAAFRAAVKKGQKSSIKVSLSKHTRVDKAGQYGQFKDGIKRPSSLTHSFFNMLTADGGKGTTTNVDQFKLELSFQSYKRIAVGPGSWFNRDVLKKYYSKGPFLGKRQNLFGNGGKMTLIPKALWVVYKPSMKMTVSRTDSFNFSKALSKSSGSGGLFGSKKSTTATVRTEYVSNDSAVVSVSSNSEVPVIVAIDFEHIRA